uniref:hypothetical protein n=1 Tax=Streptomyces calvus TaxID=67282 RepID=UPI0035183D60
MGLPQGEGSAHRVDQRRRPALIARVEGSHDKTRAVHGRGFSAAVDVVNSQVLGDVNGRVRRVDRVRKVADTADLVPTDGYLGGLAPVLLIH